MCLYPRGAIMQLDEKGVYRIKQIGSSFHPTDELLQNVPFRGKAISIPCGKCIECRLQRSRDWAVRLDMESKLYDNNIIITLTYDNEHLPHYDAKYIVPSSDWFCCYPLVKDHVSKFIRAVRDSLDHQFKVRYYAVGEYGEDSSYLITQGRPHYHVILFDVPKYKLFLAGKSGSGFPLYECPDLAKFWRFGSLRVSPFCSEMVAYISRYLLAEINGKALQSSPEYMILNGLPPSFALMSRRPGIGYQYMVDHFDELCEVGSYTMMSPPGAKVYPIPRYFVTVVESLGKFYYDKFRRSRLFSLLYSADDYERELDLRREISVDHLDHMIRPLK